MPFFEFAAKPLRVTDVLNESPDSDLPRKVNRAINDLDYNDLELLQRGYRALNAVLVPQDSAGETRQEGSFRTRTVDVITDAGFQKQEVTLFDSGRSSRDLVVEQGSTSATFQAVQTQAPPQQLEATKPRQRDADEAIYPVDGSNIESFYYQGPNTALGAANEANYAQIGSLVTAHSGGLYEGVQPGDPDYDAALIHAQAIAPPPTRTTTGGYYDPNVYGSGDFGGF